MKKILAVVLCLVMACGVFAACTKKEPEKNDPAIAESTAPVSTTAAVTTDSAKIKESDAIDLIKSYSAKELSLSDEDYKECHFLVNSSGIQIKDDYYISVVAAIMSENTGEDGKTYVNFDHRGEYYIRYDGKQILKKDMSSEEEKYTELEVKELPADDGEKEETEAASEETTK